LIAAHGAPHIAIQWGPPTNPIKKVDRKTEN
ncbi:MAG: hypothetical protein RIQ58_296, partial [Pseudomonadota bacterium]